MITASNLRNYSNAGNVAGKSIVVALGGFRWIVTCVSQDTTGNVVATLWLDDAPSELSTFGNSGSYYSSISFTEGIPCGIYGSSYIRAVTLNNGGDYANITSNSAPTTTLWATSSIDHAYGAFTHNAGVLYKYIVAPSLMPYQTVSQGANHGVDSYIRMNESLADNLTGYYSSCTFQNKSPYYTAWGTDKLWLPSLS